MYNKEEISSKGIPYKSGLEVFSTHEVLGDEILNWGNALAYRSQLGSDLDYVVQDSTSDPAVDALTESGAAETNRWYRFHTNSGSNYHGTTAPTSGDGYFTLTATKSGALLSHAGFYQELNTEKGVEYQIDVINSIDSDTATLFVNTYFPKYNFGLDKVSYKLNTTSSTTYPMTNSSTCITTSSFTAKSPKEIVLIYLTTSAADSVSVNLTNISIREKKTILEPVYSEDFYGNSQQVLRRTSELRRFNT